MLKIPRFMKEYAGYVLKRYDTEHVLDEYVEYAHNAIDSTLARYEIGMLSVNATMETLSNIEHCIEGVKA